MVKEPAERNLIQACSFCGRKNSQCAQVGDGKILSEAGALRKDFLVHTRESDIQRFHVTGCLMSYVLSFKAGKLTVGSAAEKAVLRCLCDYANEDGSSCRPATSTISAETELNKKTVFKAVASLAGAGWIEVSSLNGRQNFYQINVAKIEAAFLETKADKQQTNTKIGTGVNFGTSTKNGSGTDTKNGTKTSAKFGTSTKNGPIPVPKTVHNSVNTQSIINTSKEVFVSRAEDGSPDAPEDAKKDPQEFDLTEPKKELTPKQRSALIGSHCPHKKIIELYHQCLPELPRIRVWSEARKKTLAARWRQVAKDREIQTEKEGLDFFEGMFKFISRSPFLLGENERNWRPDLGWIIKDENMTKIINGNYHHD